MGNITIKGGNHKYDEIIYLKGIAIITISLMHLIQGFMTEIPSVINKAASFGGTGVHIFFVCSGFGLYLSHINRPLSFLQFTKRRFLKVYIPYILILTIYALVPTVKFNGDRINAWLSHVFLYKMFSPIYEISFGTHWWYLSTTFQFYFVFCILCHGKELIKKAQSQILCDG